MFASASCRNTTFRRHHPPERPGRSAPDGRTERVRETSPVNTRRGAEQYERDLRQALLSGAFGKEIAQKTKTPTLMEFEESFLRYAETNNKHGTVLLKRQILKTHLVPFFGEMPLDRIDLAAIEDFKAQMLTKLSTARARKATIKPENLRCRTRRNADGPKPLGPKTINNTLATLHALLGLAKERKLLAEVPRFKQLRAPKSVFDFLDFEEADRLVDAADPEWRAAVVTALKTGLRILTRGKLHVRRTIYRGVTGLSKGGTERTVDLPPSAVAALKAHRHLKGPCVFCEDDGSPFPDHRLRWPLARALKTGGHQPRPGPHRVARPAPHLRLSLGDEGRVPAGHPAADGPCGDQDDAALRAPEPGVEAGRSTPLGRPRVLVARKWVGQGFERT